MPTNAPPMLVLIAGPSRSGTPARPAANLAGRPVYHRIEDVPGVAAQDVA